MIIPDSKQVIYEFIRVGHSLKVTAIDMESGTEASIVGDPKLTQTELQNLAKQKLHYIQNKEGNL